jgi:hypothetical protein
MSRIALAFLALAVAGGCSANDATAPSSRGMYPNVGASADRSSSSDRHVVEVAYEKWITTYPSMAGNTSYGPGTFSGTILSRVVSADGVIIHLVAEYVVTDPQKRGHSFAALIEGDESLATQSALLTGVVTGGWMKGAPVEVQFQIIAPCDVIGRTGTCFRGTIRVQRQKHHESD